MGESAPVWYQPGHKQACLFALCLLFSATAKSGQRGVLQAAHRILLCTTDLLIPQGSSLRCGPSSSPIHLLGCPPASSLVFPPGPGTHPPSTHISQSWGSQVCGLGTGKRCSHISRDPKFICNKQLRTAGECFPVVNNKAGC